MKRSEEPPRDEAVRSRPFDLNNFVYRLVRDAMNEATRAHWLRRASQFETAKPHAGDFRGTSTPARIDERTRRLDEKALACRRRATLCELNEFEKALVFALIDDAIGVAM